MSQSCPDSTGTNSGIECPIFREVFPVLMLTHRNDLQHVAPAEKARMSHLCPISFRLRVRQGCLIFPVPCNASHGFDRAVESLLRAEKVLVHAVQIRGTAAFEDEGL
jgi:hypothetical protein